MFNGIIYHVRIYDQAFDKDILEDIFSEGDPLKP